MDVVSSFMYKPAYTTYNHFGIDAKGRHCCFFYAICTSNSVNDQVIVVYVRSQKNNAN